jgi:hypothetical protein
MLTLEASTTNQLAAILANHKGDVLYRGQLADYGSKTKSGMRTSFARHGCVPPTMVKWWHYAEFVLRQLLPDPDLIQGIELPQAVLQHYGWRSFFLDASTSAAVSAWFAGHSWCGDHTLEFVEDCFENFVILRRQQAHYEAAEGIGFLYVLSAPELRLAGIPIHDLGVLGTGVARPQAQKAQLVGPLHDDLPLSCVTVRIAAPTAIMRAFAAQHGYRATEELFPGPDQDSILRLLVSLPWTRLSLSSELDKPGNLEFYARAIEIPEYHHVALQKHLPVEYALFRHKRLSDLRFNTDIIFRTAPSVAMFGRCDEAEPVFPNVTALVRRERRVAFEVDDLIWIPETTTRNVWGKGLLVEMHGDNLISVGDLIVSHPGRKLASFGSNAGWSYRAQADGRWTRVPAVDDCPCGHEWRHRRHLESLAIIEHFWPVAVVPECVAGSGKSPMPAAPFW